MIRKRLVSLFLAVVMLCSLSMTAFAASDEDVAMSAEHGSIRQQGLTQRLRLFPSTIRMILVSLSTP